MKRKISGFLFLVVSLLIMNTFSVFAGTWVQDESTSKWHYYSDSGTALTGWVQDNEKWYYLDASGTMKTGWIKVDGSWYFCYEDGSMAADTWIDNYYVNPSGKWTKTR